MLKMDKIQRLNILKEMIAESPDDPFGYYALLLENEFENPEEILKSWTDLISKFPDYLPSYYQLGKMQEDNGQLTEAIETYKAGKKLAKRTSDMKTLGELNEALMMLDVYEE
jgi:tetratricopeptide (TPR) repeat protein